MEEQVKSQRSKVKSQNWPGLLPMLLAPVVFAVLLILAPDTSHLTPTASAAAHVITYSGPTTDTPSLAITTGTATSSATPTTGAREAHVQALFGSVLGSYGTCTMQATTTYDGSNFLALGTAQSVTVSSGTLNAWDIYQQAPVTTGVTNTTTSSTAATGFGQATEFVFACSSYGTSAPVTLSVLYK